MHLQLLQKPVYDHRLMRPAAWQLRLVFIWFDTWRPKVMRTGASWLRSEKIVCDRKFFSLPSEKIVKKIVKKVVCDRSLS